MKRVGVDDEPPVRDQPTDVSMLASVLKKLLIKESAPSSSIKRKTWAVTVTHIYPEKRVSHTHTFPGVTPKDLLGVSWHTPDGAKRLVVEEVYFKVLSHLCSL